MIKIEISQQENRNLRVILSGSDEELLTAIDSLWACVPVEHITMGLAGDLEILSSGELFLSSWLSAVEVTQSARVTRLPVAMAV